MEPRGSILCKKKKDDLNTVSHLGFEHAILKLRIQLCMGMMITPDGDLLILLAFTLYGTGDYLTEIIMLHFAGSL